MPTAYCALKVYRRVGDCEVPHLATTLGYVYSEEPAFAQTEPFISPLDFPISYIVQINIILLYDSLRDVQNIFTINCVEWYYFYYGMKMYLHKFSNPRYIPSHVHQRQRRCPTQLLASRQN